MFSNHQGLFYLKGLAAWKIVLQGNVSETRDVLLVYINN
jgi:hypothetical protein